jgi:hypothetical protein
MKKTILSVLTLALTLSAGLVFADGSDKAEMKARKYEVVDVACYVQKGASGVDHQKCAAKCISGGGELALLHNGDLFVPVDKDFKSARAKFAAKGGQEVEVKGKVISKGGINYLQISE